MLIFIKKWNLFLLVSIFAIVVFCAGLSLRRPVSRETAAVPGFGKRIILDAGHGEPDGGAVGSRGTLEKDLNLKITMFLQEYLEQNGVEVILTRTTDAGIYDAKSRTIREKKRTDLYNREKIMNQSSADLFVSIHMNKFQDSKYSGPQVFYSANMSASKTVAESVQKELIAVLNPASDRAIKRAGKDIYLLNKAKIPAILIECGFLSNKEEEERLTSEAYQKKVAWAVYCGLVRYFDPKE